MSSKRRYMTIGLLLAVLGTMIGVGLIVASFVVGVGTAEGSALSSSGTITVVAFVAPTVALSIAVSRQRHAEGTPEL